MSRRQSSPYGLRRPGPRRGGRCRRASPTGRALAGPSRRRRCTSSRSPRKTPSGPTRRCPLVSSDAGGRRSPGAERPSPGGAPSALRETKAASSSEALRNAEPRATRVPAERSDGDDLAALLRARAAVAPGSAVDAAGAARPRRGTHRTTSISGAAQVRRIAAAALPSATAATREPLLVGGGTSAHRPCTCRPRSRAGTRAYPAPWRRRSAPARRRSCRCGRARSPGATESASRLRPCSSRLEVGRASAATVSCGARVRVAQVELARPVVRRVDHRVDRVDVPRDPASASGRCRGRASPRARRRRPDANAELLQPLGRVLDELRRSPSPAASSSCRDRRSRRRPRRSGSGRSRTGSRRTRRARRPRRRRRGSPRRAGRRGSSSRARRCSARRSRRGA